MDILFIILEYALLTLIWGTWALTILVIGSFATNNY